jgi:Tfp pilus assembly pilus retraction ATPase PilT
VLDLNELLRYLMEQRGSDLHVKVASAPYVRVDGHLLPTPFDSVTPATRNGWRSRSCRRNGPTSS